MRKLASVFFSICISTLTYSQNIIADVKVDFTQVQSTNTQVYKTLERSLSNFINSTKWTDVRLKPHERIEANFLIVVTNKESNRYTANLQVQTRRPVFNSTYYTPILNLNDTNFSFDYTEFEQLVYNERKFSGKNLTDVITYYIYLILGYDADTFKLEGGTEYFKIAQKISTFAQSSRFSGWNDIDGMQSRSLLINNILKNDNSILRTINYNYHINGLDQMADNELRGKNEIAKNLLQLQYYTNGSYAQFYPLEIFIQAKKDEISKVFNGGQVSSENIEKLKEILNTVSPKNSNNWSNLKK